MWIKIAPDMEFMMEVELQGVNENTRDYDIQLYEKVIKDALMEKLTKVFPEEDLNIYALDVGVAREKYVKPKVA